MGGAGTGVPPVELLVPPLLLELVEEEVLLLVEEEVELLVEPVLPPKLDDPPEELEDDPPLVELEPDDPVLPPVEVPGLPLLPPELLLEEDEELDEDELLEELDEEVLLTPLLVLVELPPELVLVELPPVLVELPPELVLVEPPLVLVEPPLVVEETTTLPPPLEPPPKKPPKNPPLPPKPPLPPITTGTPPPPAIAISPGIGAGGGSGTGAAAVVTVTAAGAQAVVVTVRLTTFTSFWGFAAFTDLLDLTSAGRGADSAMWTAPPPTIAPPQAHAHNFAKAIRTDIADTLLVAFLSEYAGRRPRRHAVLSAQTQKKALTATALTVISKVEWLISLPSHD